MSNVKKGDSTKKADNTTTNAGSGAGPGNIADNKKSGSGKEDRAAETTKAEANKKNLGDTKNTKTK